MTLDKEEHRAMLLHVLGQIQVPLSVAREALALEDAVKAAFVAPQSEPAPSEVKVVVQEGATFKAVIANGAS